MGEAIVQRDERGRIVGLTVQAGGMSVLARASATTLLRAVAESLTDYLHVAVASSFADEIFLEIDRSDQHLDREIDAILATMGSGLRFVERDYPAELLIHDTAVGVEV
ncbi:hypothetical protein IH601_11600 [Candidatus Bipolaricaulota bacterium]|nr:hypothetical protein [Candidatus Bipolaricaulota bacterium]TFH09002.1 MAG: hypothetical protein E4H08_06645 [Candidatus Atribacteria bacterium]